MEKNLTIAIDVDGVLRDNLGEMVNLYNKEFNDNKKVEEITEFKTELSFPRILQESGVTSSQWFFQNHSKELFVDAKAFANAAEDIKMLQGYGKVIIVTYQKSYLNKHQTLEWLEKNGIEPDGVCFLRDKTQLHADIFVDDNDWNFIGCNCDNGILINAPYNKKINVSELTEKSNCESIVRYDSLHDFVLDFCKSMTKKESTASVSWFA